jgi:uncharacterized NAD(P)/FAD-binding protein YdhS
MQTLSGHLLELVRELDELGTAPSLVALAHAMKGAQLTPADVADFVHPNSRSYNRAPVVVREAYDLLVMTWLPGQASVPHDHAGSICVMQVMQGEAVEGSYEVAPDGYVDLEYETKARSGEILAGHDAGVHTVRNSSQTGELLVTVHLYAPPLKDFRQFTPRPETSGETRHRKQDRLPTVVVVGGGFSGTMTAAQILRRSYKSGKRVKVVLVERRGSVGEGVAYSTRENSHLLNVSAGNMSAWPERRDDFVRWAVRRNANVVSTDFLPRKWYGEYVRECLLTTAHEVGDSAELVVTFDEVRRVARHPSGGWMVHLGRGPSLRADVVVLAIGHRPPLDPGGLQWRGPRTRLISDPWRPFAMNVVGPDESVVVLGSGLTAVDAVLSLTQQGRQTQITLLSRNGLLPQAHAAAQVTPVDLRSWVAEVSALPGGARLEILFRHIRRMVRELTPRGVDWRSVVDALRPHTAELWQRMPTAERLRFLSRLRPFWEVHRHRMPCTVAERLRKLLERGEVRVVAGRAESAEAERDCVRLMVRERASDRLVEWRPGWVINCTGPVPSNSVESNPVIGSLLVSGWLHPDELALGVETSASGKAVAEDGREVCDLFVVGTLRKPAIWESTAVPELRSQAATIADCILGFLAER